MTADKITDLVPSVSLENLLAQRDAMAERVREAHRLLAEAVDISRVALEGWHVGYALDLETTRQRRSFTDGDAGLAFFLKSIDVEFWSFLFSQSGLRTFMDAEARHKWDDAISKRDVPPLTRENIEATFAGLHGQRREMFERGVVSAFRSLSWDYKTNNPVMFGKRLILRHVSNTWRHSGNTLSPRGADQLDDLARVFYVIDNQPEPDHRRGAFFRLQEARALEAGAPCDLGYFTVRLFKNGNGHLVFTRPELVDRLNLIVAKHYPSALAPAREGKAA